MPVINCYQNAYFYYEMRNLPLNKGLAGILQHNTSFVDIQKIAKCLREEGYDAHFLNLARYTLSDNDKEVLESKPELSKEAVDILKLSGYEVKQLNETEAKQLQVFVESEAESIERSKSALMVG